ncbi:MAG: type 1 glutamine amidotransferase [Synergistaceae bacterium]|nr:type 1 glutamine amidotransferase [Synergistaceae bacterium]
MSKRVAVLVEENVHDFEFWYPFYRLQEAGYEPVTLGPEAGKIYMGKMGNPIKASHSPRELSPSDVAGVVVPGGWAPDRLRTHKSIVDFVRGVSEAGGMVAAICHGGSVLVSAGILKGKKATSFISIRDDMILAGADWVDEPVVVSGKLVTSRTPADLPYFGKALLEALK